LRSGSGHHVLPLVTSSTPRQLRRTGIRASISSQAGTIACFSPDASIVDSPFSAVSEHSVGSMENRCDKCEAAYFQDEAPKGKFVKCCNTGSISLPSSIDVPEFLCKLLGGSNEKSKAFRDNVRRYNNCLSIAFTSYRDAQPERRGVPCVIVYGEVKHLLSPLDRGGDTRLYGECYTIDPSIANEMPRSQDSGAVCDPDILRELDAVIRRENPFAQAYLLMHERVQHFVSLGRTPPSVRMWVVSNPADSARSFHGATVGRMVFPPGRSCEWV
jgi:hypothetical protein